MGPKQVGNTAGGHKIKKKEKKEARKKKQVNLINSKSTWKDREKKERGSGKGGRKKDDYY